MAKNYYQKSVESVVRQLKTNLTRGLACEDIAALRERDGFNEFAKKQHSSLWHKFISQFKSYMIIVLLLAAVISGITGYMNGEGVTDAIIILSILIVNAIIGVLQEAKAENALDTLEKLSAPHCKVIRGGEHKVIESRELVVGYNCTCYAFDSLCNACACNAVVVQTDGSYSGSMVDSCGIVVCCTCA